MKYRITLYDQEMEDLRNAIQDSIMHCRSHLKTLPPYEQSTDAQEVHQEIVRLQCLLSKLNAHFDQGTAG